MNKIKRFVESIIEKIEALACSLIDREDLFLVEVEMSGNEGNRKISVYLDGDKGISINDCTKISRKLSNQLDEADLISGKFILEVSSHGLDKPLKLKRQYQKNIGRALNVRLNDRTSFEGTLKSINDDSLILSIEKKGKTKKERGTEVVTLPFESIQRAKVALDI